LLSEIDTSTIELDDPPDGELESCAAPVGRTSASRRRSAKANRWMRWLHVYTSMISLLVVLFFGITGLTLNHPSWTFGDGVDRSTYSGSLPGEYLAADGDPDFLAISEYARSEYSVGGDVADYGVAGGEGTISYKGPGYAADLFFQVDSGEFDLVVEQQGFVAVMNDLHKGRDTSSTWKWVIDISAIVLVVVAVTGLGIQLFQRKRRTRALVLGGFGGLVTVVLVAVTMV